MSAIGQYFLSSFFGARESETEAGGSTASPTSIYQPSVADVLSVKRSFLRRTSLPLELIDAIIDCAEYWPHTTSLISGSKIAVTAGGERENKFIIRSYPLGLVPELERNSEYSVIDYYVETLHRLAPQPWAEGREVPHASTQEVLAGWSRSSQPRGEFPCRKIVFTINSHDQGWGGDTDGQTRYDGSYSWFEVGKEEISAFREGAILEAWELAPWPQFRLALPSEFDTESGIDTPMPSNQSHLVCSLRSVSPPVWKPSENDNGDSSKGLHFKHDLLPSDDCLQKNRVAERKSTEHKIIWSYHDNIQPGSDEAVQLEERGRGVASATGDYVRNLKLGDTVTIWAKARFPGWVNVIDDIKIELYWAV